MERSTVTTVLLLLFCLNSFLIHFGKCQLNSELLNWIPQITVFDNFLSPLECDLLVEAAKNNSRYMEGSKESQSIYLQEYPKLRKEFRDIGTTKAVTDFKKTVSISYIIWCFTSQKRESAPSPENLLIPTKSRSIFITIREST